MSEFEQQRRQNLLHEDFYFYIQERDAFQLTEFTNKINTLKDPYLEPMVDIYYSQACLDYTAGKPITNVLNSMSQAIEYTKATISYIERHNKKYPLKPIDATIFSKFMETEFLPNIIGISILSGRRDWFDTLVTATDLSLWDDTEKTIDSLIALYRPGYPITTATTPRELSFRTPLFKAIHAKTEKTTLKNLNDYLHGWYDGLRKADDGYIDSHIIQHSDSRDCCSFHGYWCFEAAAVAYLKGIDDTTLHHYLYYPKDMVNYARSLRVNTHA
ncbi:PoNe immunity protein domain-containing protein [Klebsiella aerogenes]